MKEKWSVLPISRRILCVVNVVIPVIFLIVYLLLSNNTVFRYKDSILSASKTDNEITFVGEIDGVQAEVSLFSDMTLNYTLDGVAHGPFRIVDDPTATPVDNGLIDPSLYIGINILSGDEIIFRGGYHKYTSGLLLTNENGKIYSAPSDPGKADALLILTFSRFASVVRQSNWLFFIMACSFTGLTLLTAFFVEPFFRANMPMSKSEREAKAQEKPSRMRTFLSWFSWVCLTIGSIVLFAVGLMAF